MRALDAIDRAREADEVTEVEGDPGLFVVEPLTPDGLHTEAYYLDLRDGFAFYGYDEVGEPIRGDEKAEPPTVVKEIRAHHMAEGTAKLSQFARTDNGDIGE